MQPPSREIGSMTNRDDDLLYFAQKVKRAKSTQAKLRAVKQLELLVQAVRITTEMQLKKERQ